LSYTSTTHYAFMARCSIKKNTEATLPLVLYSSPLVIRNIRSRGVSGLDI